MIQSNLIPLLLLVAAASPVFAQNETIGCFVDGECQGGTTTGISIVPTANECLAFCDTLDTCSFFTFENSGGICVSYLDCPEVTNATCFDCLSGDASCPDLICDEPGTLSNIFQLSLIVSMYLSLLRRSCKSSLYNYVQSEYFL